MNTEQIAIDRLMFDADEVQSMLVSMSDAIRACHVTPDSLVIIGIQQKGVLVKDAMLRLLKQSWSSKDISTGELDIGMFRDDLGANPVPHIQPTSIPDHLDGMDVILVDDVLQSGRIYSGGIGCFEGFWSSSIHTAGRLI